MKNWLVSACLLFCVIVETAGAQPYGLGTATTLGQSAVPFIFAPNGYMDATGNLVLGQTPGSSATISFSATSGSVTATYSAGTPLAGDSDAHDVGRILVVLDTTYKWCTITAHLTSTTATCTLNATLSGTGPFSNAANWLSGPVYTATNAAGADAVIHSVPLPVVFASAYVYLPTSAPSGTGANSQWFYCTMTGLATGLCYNNTYTSGSNPTIPSPTAFSGLTPGVYTQTTGSLLTGPSYTLIGGTMGINGSVDAEAFSQNNNSAAQKTLAVLLSTAQAIYLGQTTNTTTTTQGRCRNAASASVQYCFDWFTAGGAASLLTSGAYAIATGSSQTVAVKYQLATATDFVLSISYSIGVRPN